MSLISVPPPPMDSRIGLYITDGTVTWIVDDVRDGTPVGSVRGSLYLPKGYIKANGATVNRADYPRLVKFIETNNLWTDDTAGNLGLFGKGDGNTTFVLPNYSQRYVQYTEGKGTTIEAGLPNITGDTRKYFRGGILADAPSDSGCFSFEVTDIDVYWANVDNPYRNRGSFKFDASKSNAIYGASDTVQPPSIAFIPIIRY